MYASAWAKLAAEDGLWFEKLLYWNVNCVQFYETLFSASPSLIFFFFNGYVILDFLTVQLRLEVVGVSRVGIKLGIIALKTCIVEYSTEALRVGRAIWRPHNFDTDCSHHCVLRNFVRLIAQAVLSN